MEDEFKLMTVSIIIEKVFVSMLTQPRKEIVMLDSITAAFVFACMFNNYTLPNIKSALILLSDKEM